MDALNTLDVRTVKARVGDLTGEIAERIREIESERRLPADFHERLRDAGVYRLLVPAAYGGLQASTSDVLDVLETLAGADASVAWVASIGLQTPYILSLLSKEAFEELYSCGPDLTIGGALGPQGTAQIVEGGYRATGKWGFGSGCDNWDYLFANCVIDRSGPPTAGDPPASRPPIDGPPAGGPPPMRAVLVPREEAELLDTWYTLGLRGTGSKDFKLDGVFVDADHTFDLAAAAPCVEGIYRYPVLEFGHHLVSIAIGVAQGAIDDLAQSAASRHRVFSTTSLAANPVIQHRIGKAQTSLQAARDLSRRHAVSLISGEAGDDFTELLVETSAKNAWVVDTCIDVVSTCFRSYGAKGIYDDAMMQRRLRDIYTIAQHATLNDSAWTRKGEKLFGENVGV